MILWILLGWIALILLMVGQALWMRLTVPRLPEAEGPRSGVEGDGSSTMQLLVVGESTAAGVGAPTQNQALAWPLATKLAAALGARVHWQIEAMSGQRISPLADTLSDLQCEADLVLISIGVNDAIRMLSARRFLQELERIEAALTKTHSPRILIAGLPDMTQFPAAPVPLRFWFGWRSRVLDRVLAKWAAQSLNRLWVATRIPDQTAFADDGFHPGPAGYDLWSSNLSEEYLRWRNKHNT